MLICPKCNSDANMVLESNFSFGDLGYDGDGIVDFYECLKCGTKIEVSIPFDAENAEQWG